MKHLVSILAFAVIALIVSHAQATTCTSVSGYGDALDAPCLDAPLGLCVEGNIHGSFEGTYRATHDSLVPAPTLTQPLRFAIELTSVITTSTGTLSSHETGYIVMNNTFGAAACVAGCGLSQTCLAGCLSTYGRTYFTQYLTPYAGTGAYANPSGSIVVTGTGDYVTQQNVVSYSGNVCTP